MANNVPHILYEDNHIIVVNKQVSDLVQGDKTGDISLDKILKSFLKKKYNKPGNVFLGVAHRLDRPVSGVVLFAKTSKALSRVNKAFHDKTVSKFYWAIVKDKPPRKRDRLTHYLYRNQKKNKSFAYNEPRENTKKAVLDYTLLARSENYYLLEIELHTGRHHQIRSQLAAIGCPIKGDLKYGFPRSNPDGGICLHARMLSIIHPTRKEEMTFTADPPGDKLWTYFKREIEEGTAR